MASLKLHAVIGTNHGTESADFRGDNFIGHEQGDEHRTLAELDPATDEQVNEALVVFPILNQHLAQLGPLALANGLVHDLTGKDVFLRFGIWDE